MRILIKGAGDLATGIACRLYRSGYRKLLMTEISVPTTVRRTVAFSRAVYEGQAVVEGIRARCVSKPEEVFALQQQGEIAVVVDPEGLLRESYQPQVVIDAIIGKKNLGTTCQDAPFVIGVGPGFEAGVDCHAVVETQRGHDLGRVLYKGSAIPNTGIPGDVGGYTVERIIRSQAEGIFHPLVKIGQQVQKGEPVGEVAGVYTHAGLTGIVRGMLQENVRVTRGMKCGDIDPRCRKEHCITVSDKARAIGGGVLEAVCCFEKERRKS